MGMFGLVYTGVVLLCKGIVGIQNGVNDAVSRSHSESIGKLTYFDHRGASRLTSTGEYVYHAELPNGERVLKKMGGEVVYNFDIDSKRKRKNEKNEQIKKIYPELELLGAFEDLYPERFRKGLWKYVSPKAAVYKDTRNGRLLFMTGKTQCDQHIFVDVEDGSYLFLYNEKASDFWKKQLEDSNKSEITHQNIIEKHLDLCF